MSGERVTLLWDGKTGQASIESIERHDYAVALRFEGKSAVSFLPASVDIPMLRLKSGGTH